MTLRGRITSTSVVIVGVILTAGALLCFWVMRAELHGQIDSQLRDQAELIRTERPRLPQPGDRLQFPLPITAASKRSSGDPPYSQFIRRSGKTVAIGPGALRLPVSQVDLAVARGQRSAPALHDANARGTHVRVITVAVPGGAVQFGRSLAGTDSVLSRLRLVLAGLVGGGLALAAVLSRLSSRRVIAPIRALTAATEHVEATGDLGRRVDVPRDDEVGRLASRFNSMLERVQQTQSALEASTDAQRQLVADASHELRTPLASLRTNVEVLLASDNRAGADEELLTEVLEQTEELSALVSDLIELARGDRPPEHVEELDLGEIAREALARARRHAPGLNFEAHIEPSPMTGSPERLGRAVSNLLDNAAKFSPDGSTIELRLAGGELSVRDHGPGVSGEDLPHIFDRFFRARNARHMHGSGLGLAIVKQVVESHGGSLHAVPAEGGGLRVVMCLPRSDALWPGRRRAHPSAVSV